MAHHFKETQPHEKGFKNYFESELVPLLHKVEEHRKNALKHFLEITFACILATIILPILIHIVFDEIEWTYGSFGLFIIVTFFLSKYLLNRFKNTAGEKVSTILVKFFGDFNYQRNLDKYVEIMTNLTPKTNDKTEVKKYSQIINHIIDNARPIFPAFDYITYEDIIYGNYNNNKIEFCEIKMEQKMLEGSRDCPITTFKGIFIVLTLEKNFASQTIITQKQNIISKLLGSTPRHEKVKLKNKAFNKHQEVYSNDPEETNTILTSTAQQAIMKLAKDFKRKNIRGYIFKNKAIFAIQTKKNFFESVSLFQSAYNKKRFKTFLKDFNSILNFSDTIISTINQNNTTTKNKQGVKSATTF